jgi:hypothetical protein
MKKTLLILAAAMLLLLGPVGPKAMASQPICSPIGCS